MQDTFAVVLFTDIFIIFEPLAQWGTYGIMNLWCITTWNSVQTRKCKFKICYITLQPDSHWTSFPYYVTRSRCYDIHPKLCRNRERALWYVQTFVVVCTLDFIEALDQCVVYLPTYRRHARKVHRPNAFLIEF